MAPLFKLSAQYPDSLMPMLGLHPCSVRSDYRSVLDEMHGLIFTSTLKIWGIGETGLDYYWDKTFAEEQKEAFRIQVRWAAESGLPVIIHTRDSMDDALEIVKSENTPALRGIFHCFSGDTKHALQIAELGGFKIGIGGVVTFKNSKLPQTLREIPASLIVLETDSPYLAPAPHRGSRNESAYIPLIAQTVASVLGLSLQQVSEITQENAKAVFGVPGHDFFTSFAL